MKRKTAEFTRLIIVALFASCTSMAAVTLSGSLNQFESREVLSAARMNENFALLKDALETAAHMNHIAPVGAVIAWHKTLPGTPGLPSGWLECNGQVVNDSASVYDGQTLPDLNGQARFLRGGMVSGVLQAQSFQAHSHGYESLIRTFNTGQINNRIAGFPGARIEAGEGARTTTIAGTAETRPVNMSVVWIIRVR